MDHDDQMRTFYAAELPTRFERGLTPDRERVLTGFVQECRTRSLTSVVEVGCGAGRDAVVMAAAMDYTGSDLSSVGVELCRDRGLTAVVASATDLPWTDDSADSAWTMSTLMHLPGEDIVAAVAELGRVVRPGGMVEVGLWGADEDRPWVDPNGRYFRHRTDERIRDLLGAIGTVEAFDSWDRIADGGHYQWARVAVS